MRREHILWHRRSPCGAKWNVLPRTWGYSGEGGWPKPLKMRTILQLNFIRSSASVALIHEPRLFEGGAHWMQHRNVLFLFNSIFLVCFNNLQALTKHLLIVRNRFSPHISFILPGKYLLNFDLTIPSKSKGLLSPAWKGTLLLSLLLVLLRYQTV